MNGRVTPVSGTTRSTPPTMMNAWTPRMVVSPAASSFSKSFVVRRAVRMPAPTSSTNAASTAVAPISPSSSPMEEKMKSLCDAGTICGEPSPSPVPVMPPFASPKRAWMFW